MRWLVLCLALMPMPALAQDKAQTLADIKSELTSLMAQFNSLKSELVSSGAASSGAAGGDALQRMDAIEAELARLTNKTEEVDARLRSVVSDGTNRIGDIEFRLCEVTKGCDPASLPDTPTLGGGGAVAAAPQVIPDPATADSGGAELAIGEKTDFDRAKGVLGQGDFRAAADQFAAFTQSFPGSPLSQEANLLRGDALSQLGETSNAARAYLEAFSGKPDGPFAGQALLKLGQALGSLGQTPEACVTLGEVGVRFPGTIDATNASVAMQGLGCS
ncbi:MAG: tol-pal system protein YbgF [Cypionkella sp.]|nr:tol-pal system protein YbgF [Cypionkella sp.]